MVVPSAILLKLAIAVAHIHVTAPPTPISAPVYAELEVVSMGAPSSVTPLKTVLDPLAECAPLMSCNPPERCVVQEGLTFV
jgi:hypothetical protein